MGESLQAAGLEYRRLAECIDPEDPQGVDWDLDERVIRWFKSRGRAGLDGTSSFRETFRHGTMALWWWAELYLYPETPLRALVRDVLAVTRLVESTSCEELMLVRPSEARNRRWIRPGNGAVVTQQPL